MRACKVFRVHACDMKPQGFGERYEGKSESMDRANGFAVQEVLFLDEDASRPPLPGQDGVRLLTWNVRGPSLERARLQVSWLLQRGADILILTELRCNNALAFYCAFLEHHGYQVKCAPTTNTDYVVLIAVRTRYVEIVDIGVTYASQRAQAVRLPTAIGELTVVGLYVPSRGPSHSRNVAKRRFQEEVELRLSDLVRSQPCSLIVGGDLNVLERNHAPHYAVFGEWEYDFYDSFSKIGLMDAFRALHPDTAAYSWFGRGGNGYRFDHLFISSNLIECLRCCSYATEVLANGLSDHAAMEAVLERSSGEGHRETVNTESPAGER